MKIGTGGPPVGAGSVTVVLNRCTVIVKAWSNGAHHPTGAGYGLKVSAADRDRYFRREWGTATIELPNGVCAHVNIDKNSFWNTSCRELISHEIGQWLLHTRLAPWTADEPPDLLLEPIVRNRFRLDANLIG